MLCLFPFARHFVDMVPDSLKNSIAVSIGLFIAFIGLQWAGIVITQEGTIAGLGDFTKDYTILAIIGFVITSILIVLEIKGALLIGIISTAIIGIPLGFVEYYGIVSFPPSVLPTFMKLELLEAI